MLSVDLPIFTGSKLKLLDQNEMTAEGLKVNLTQTFTSILNKNCNRFLMFNISLFHIYLKNPTVFMCIFIVLNYL